MSKIKHHFDSQLMTIQKSYTQEVVKKDKELFRACLKTIKNKRKIIATALGKNVPICEKFVGTLISVGIPAYFLHTNSAIHGDLGFVQDGDLVIALSKSGNTQETIVLLKILQKFNTNNWLLTCNSKAKGLKFVENAIIFNLPHEGDIWNLIPNNSTLLFLAFLQALAMSLIEELNVPIEVFKRNHPGGDIGRKLGIKL